MHLDPNGLRPLSIGKLGDAYVVASETCAFDFVGAEFVRDVEPGELLLLMMMELHSEHVCYMHTNKQCVRWNMFIFHVLIVIFTGSMFIQHVKVLGKRLQIEATY